MVIAYDFGRGWKCGKNYGAAIVFEKSKASELWLGNKQQGIYCKGINQCGCEEKGAMLGLYLQ